MRAWVLILHKQELHLIWCDILATKRCTVMQRWFMPLIDVGHLWNGQCARNWLFELKQEVLSSYLVLENACFINVFWTVVPSRIMKCHFLMLAQRLIVCVTHRKSTTMSQKKKCLLQQCLLWTAREKCHKQLFFMGVHCLDPKATVFILTVIHSKEVCSFTVHNITTT